MVTLSDGGGQEALELSVMGSGDQPVYTSALGTPVQSNQSSRAGTPKTDQDNQELDRSPLMPKQSHNNNVINTSMAHKQSREFKDVQNKSQRSTSSGSNLDTDDGAQSIHTSPSGTGSQVSPVSKNHLIHEINNEVNLHHSVECLIDVTSNSFNIEPAKKGTFSKHESIS